MYYSKEIPEVIESLNTTPKGLSNQERERRLSVDGKNAVVTVVPNRLLGILKAQLFNLLVLVLVIAAVLSYLTGHIADAIVIASVIAINTIVGVIQEYRAEKALSSLQKLLVKKCKILVDGKPKIINSEDLVKGDIVVIEEGDIIPADGRIIKSTLFKTNESGLTGESLPVNKNTETLRSGVGVSDQSNMVFSSTTCVSGRAEYVVTATGSETEVGKIAVNLTTIEENDTQFLLITNRLTKQMAAIALAGTAFILFIGYFVYGYEFAEIFLFSLASLVSAIPEGLPAILTIVLAIGSYRMAKKKAIVRRLASTETLASVNIICTDKTGTLTENNLKVEQLILNNDAATILNEDDTNDSEEYIKSLLISYYCNGSQIVVDADGTTKVGDPTEIAMKDFADKYPDLMDHTVEVLEDIPFSSDRKFRATKVKLNGQITTLIAGAPETLLELTDIPEERSELIKQQISELSKKALRVIALGESSISDFDIYDPKGIKLYGFVAMRDPIREGTPEAVAKTKLAGIRVIMLTGDHIETAKAIAVDCGIAEANNVSAYDEKELLALSEAEFEDVIGTVNVFARLSPNTKLRILKTLQAQGNIVAMTGDGVNDAPALKQADIGISMGRNGTETAREASDIVLSDDNFATIIDAVEEGRLVFQNIRRASAFLITTNVAEQITIIVTLVLGLPLPLLAAQILWLNLVTDGVTDFALSTERSHSTVLNHKPRDKKENIINKEILRQVFIFSGVMAVLTYLFFQNSLSVSVEYARTEAFLIMSFTQLFNALNLRSFKFSLFQIGVFSNKFIVAGFLVSGLLTFLAIYTPFLSSYLSFESVPLDRLLIIFAVSSLVLVLGELWKLVKRRTMHVSTIH